MARNTRWRSLIEIDPERAKKELTAAVRRHNGNLRETAKELGLSRPALYSYLEELKMAAVLKEARS